MADLEPPSVAQDVGLFVAILVICALFLFAFGFCYAAFAPGHPAMFKNFPGSAWTPEGSAGRSAEASRYRRTLLHRAHNTAPEGRTQNGDFPRRTAI